MDTSGGDPRHFTTSLETPLAPPCFLQARSQLPRTILRHSTPAGQTWSWNKPEAFKFSPAPLSSRNLSRSRCARSEQTGCKEALALGARQECELGPQEHGAARLCHSLERRGTSNTGFLSSAHPGEVFLDYLAWRGKRRSCR